MRFTLVFKGDLPPNASSPEKWRIRRALEPQLRRLWTTDPVAEAIGGFSDPNHSPSGSYVGKKVDQIEYVPIISNKLSLRAELDVFLLSSSLPGGVLHGGDIDARLKTLFDSLSVPANPQQVPKDATTEDDKRVFCLLEDDRLITRVTISNDRLLTIDEGDRKILAIIQVRPIAFLVTPANISIAR